MDSESHLQSKMGEGGGGREREGEGGRRGGEVTRFAWDQMERISVYFLKQNCLICKLLNVHQSYVFCHYCTYHFIIGMTFDDTWAIFIRLITS